MPDGFVDIPRQNWFEEQKLLPVGETGEGFVWILLRGDENLDCMIDGDYTALALVEMIFLWDGLILRIAPL